MKRLAVALSLVLGLFAATHAAPPDPARYLLTEATMQKLKAAQQDLQRSGIDTNEDLSGNDSVEGIAQRIEARPEVRDVMARHGLTPIECALSVHAVLHAGLHLVAEQEQDRTRTAQMLAGYTDEQRANIEFLRRAQRGR